MPAVVVRYIKMREPKTVSAERICLAFPPIHAYRVKEVKHELSISCESAQMRLSGQILGTLTNEKKGELLSIIQPMHSE